MMRRDIRISIRKKPKDTTDSAQKSQGLEHHRVVEDVRRDEEIKDLKSTNSVVTRDDMAKHGAFSKTLPQNVKDQAHPSNDPKIQKEVKKEETKAQKQDIEEENKETELKINQVYNAEKNIDKDDAKEQKDADKKTAKDVKETKKEAVDENAKKDTFTGSQRVDKKWQDIAQHPADTDYNYKKDAVKGEYYKEKANENADLKVGIKGSENPVSDTRL